VEPPAPPPEPQIILVGTVADSAGGVALFEVDGQRRAVPGGEFITPNARLLRVERDRVVIGAATSDGRPSGQRIVTLVGGRITGIPGTPAAEPQEPGLPQVVSIISGQRGAFAVLTDGVSPFDARAGDRLPSGGYTVERVDSAGVIVTDGRRHIRLSPYRPATQPPVQPPSGPPSASGGGSPSP
jgi:hypothetical protein